MGSDAALNSSMDCIQLWSFCGNTDHGHPHKPGVQQKIINSSSQTCCPCSEPWWPCDWLACSEQLVKAPGCCQHPVSLTQQHLPLPLQPSLTPVTTISTPHTNRSVSPSFLPSLAHSFIVVALETAVCHMAYFFFTWTELHANNYCKKSLVCLKLSGFGSTVVNGPLLRLSSTVQLLPRVRLVLWLGRVASRHHHLQFSQIASIILNCSLNTYLYKHR